MRSAPVSTGLTIGPFQSPGLNSDILNGSRISTEGDIAFGIAIGVGRFGFIRIVGDVVLGDGVHTFVFGNGGTLSGNLFLGGGNDLVLIENGSGTTDISDFAALHKMHFDRRSPSNPVIRA